jgi:hypothetical protein
LRVGGQNVTNTSPSARTLVEFLDFNCNQ